MFGAKMRGLYDEEWPQEFDYSAIKQRW